jgi:two-component sensor histidine kinase
LAAHAGLDEQARRYFQRIISNWETIPELMQEQFRVRNCYLVPREELSRHAHGCSELTPINQIPIDQDCPHPELSLLVPIEIRQGQIQGVIFADQSLDQPQPSQETLQTMEIFANLAAIAIENTRLYQQLHREQGERARAQAALRRLDEQVEQRILERTVRLREENAELARKVNERVQAEAELVRRNRELLSLQSAAAATASSLDLHFVLETVTWEMAGLLGVQACVISEWDPKEDTLRVLAEYGATNWNEETRVIEAYSLADHAFRKRALAERYAQQMITSQPDADPAELAHMQKSGIKAQLLLPMVFQDRVVGLIEIKESRAERFFTDHEISLAQLLANQVASAIENARLYERAQREIAERLRAEEQIRASLKEKELLLKEIHHRVKNNLQVISSLLSLQSKNIQDPSALELFRESQNRIRSMALIHERLYRSDDLAGIDFGDYVHNLSTFLVRSYRANSGPVGLKVNANNIFLGIDSAVPCGLIINELVSNALKHAFPQTGPNTGEKENEIRVELGADPDRQVTLIVGDNGIGFPQDVDFRNTESLGMQLVTTLVNQLNGSLELDSNDGTQFTIRFPMS